MAVTHLSASENFNANHWSETSIRNATPLQAATPEERVGGSLPDVFQKGVAKLVRGITPLVSLRLSTGPIGQPKNESDKPEMATYYVSTTGTNSGNGSASSPFSSITQAVNSGLRPGDEVVVKSGTYRESVYVGIDGSAAGDITIRSEVPGGAKIMPGSSGNGFTIEGSYITIDGFDISGSSYHGIEAKNSHHISLLNNISHDNGASGLSAIYGEFYLIEGNTTYSNASSNWFSGISVYENRNITGDTTTEGFRTIIRNNISYDNVTQSGQHTDGNGIIIDDFQHTQASGYPSYTYPTLVENNLVYENGGKGIQVTWSDNVTVRGNTAYHNNQDLQNTGTWRGEISNSQSSNNTFVNNIAVADPSIDSDNRALDNTSYGGYKNENVVWSNNLTYNGVDGQASVRTDGGNAMPSASDGNLLGVNPEFVGAPGDFRLGSDSAAIDAGTDEYGLASTDLDGGSREDGQVDIGAYESGDGAAPTTPSNQAPDAVNDSGFSTSEGTAITIKASQLLANDTDADGDSLSITGVRGAQNGTVTMVDSNTIRFTPNADYSGDASFRYTVSDGKGGTDTAQVAINVEADATTPGGGSSVIGEAGVVVQDQSDAGTWHHVTFENALDNPSVVMGGFSANGSQPYTVQIQNVTSTGFDFQIDEWDYLDGTHVAESISWIAIESGTHVLADGRTISAGSDSIGNRFESISFDDGAFDDAPVVIGQSIGDMNDIAVTERINNVTSNGFKARLFQQEAKDGKIAATDFNWIAVEEGGNATDGALAGSTGDAVNHQATELSFDGTFTADAFAFATGMQTTNGRDTATVQLLDLDEDSVTLRVREERSLDSELNHRMEDVGFVGFELGAIEGTSYDLTPY